MLVASLGADVGFTLDEIDDVRLAVTEVFASAADDASVGRLSCSFLPSAGRLAITMFALGPTAIELDELATTILGSVVDDVEVGGGIVTITKQASEALG
ncbi:MAG: hypothetical protein AAGG08_16690 [Actinomycetota bacterium]